MRMPTAFLSIVAAILTASGSSAVDFRQAQPDEHAAAMAILDDSLTREHLDAVLGRAPSRCIESSPGQKACIWELSRRESGWQPLSHALSTHRRVAVICELPNDGGERSRNACFAVPMESNRTKFRAVARKATRNRTKQKRLGDLRDEAQRAGQQHLEGATTFFELVRLVGALPDTCRPHEGTEKKCVWKASARTYGHGTLAASIRASMSKRVRLECVLPADAGLRAPNSCTVTVDR